MPWRWKPQKWLPLRANHAAHLQQKCLRLLTADGLQPLQPVPAQVVVAQNVGLVFRVAPGAPAGDGDGHAQPGEDQLVQQRHLLALQRVQRVVAGDQLGGGIQRAGIVGQLVGTGHRQLVDQRRLHHVAKVDQPAGGDMILRVDQHVVGVEVIVDHLPAQAGQRRLDLAPEMLDKRRQRVGLRPWRQLGQQRLLLLAVLDISRSINGKNKDFIKQASH